MAEKKKKTTTKKSTKSVATKKSKGKKVDPDKKKLQDALKEYADELDMESLAFLVQQARVLQQRLKVKELSEQYEHLDPKAIARDRAGASKENLEVKEADDGSHFIFVINGARNFFSLEEMRTMVKMCHAAKGAGEGARRLFNWFGQNRTDVLSDTSIGGPTDQALVTMYEYIINNYTVRS